VCRRTEETDQNQESKLKWEATTPPTIRTNSQDTVTRDLTSLKQAQLELQTELAGLSPTQLRIAALEEERAERVSSPRYQDLDFGVELRSSKEGVVKISNVLPGGEVLLSRVEYCNW
jgi:hypothetical protein